MNCNKNKSSRIITKHFLSIFLVMMLIFTMIAGLGCENPFATEIMENNDVEGNGNGGDSGDTIPEVNDIPDEEKTLNVAVFFGDTEAINMGNPGDYGYVKEVTRRISYNENGEELLAKTLKLLIAGPEYNGAVDDADEDNGLYPVISPDTVILDISIDEDNNAVVNLSQEAGVSTGGTLGGAIFTQAMVYTATQFPSVETLQVLVEGSPWSDGHSIWENPIGRNDL